MILGVRPAFQRYGLEAGMVLAPFAEVQAMGFREIELGWVGDFNPSMQAVLDATGAERTKEHRTYRLLFAGGGASQYAGAIVRDARSVSAKEGGRE